MKTLDDKNPIEGTGHLTGHTPLHWAALNGYRDMCELLIQNIEDKNPRNIEGWTPLHFAAKEGYFDICQLIASHLEDKNPATDGGTTPKQLMKAYIRKLNKDTNDLFQ